MKTVKVATGYGEHIDVRTARFDDHGVDVMVEAEWPEFALTPARARRLAAALLRAADEAERGSK